MSYSRPTPRVRRKRRDPMVIGLLLLSLAAIPVLGVVAWKESQRRQAEPPPLEVRQAPQPQSPAPSAPAKPRETSSATNNAGAFNKFNQVGSQGAMQTDDTGTGVLPSSSPPASSPVALTPEPASPAPPPNPLGIPQDTSALAGYVPTDASAAAMKELGDNLKNMLGADGKLLVIWMFDDSPSAEVQRRDVTGQLDDLYQRLQVPATAKADDTSRVLSVVGSFASKVNFQTPEPLAGYKAVQAAAEKIETGTGTVEMPFLAVKTALDKYLSYRTDKKRYVTIVVVTDEVGDDEARLDDLLPTLLRYQIPVSVIGQEASFGRAVGGGLGLEGELPKPGERSRAILAVRQGPESRELEWAPVEFTLGTDLTAPNLEFHTGLGPYCLARMCFESGGKFYALPQAAAAGNTLLNLTTTLMSTDEMGDDNSYWDTVNKSAGGMLNSSSFGGSSDPYGKVSLEGYTPRYMSDEEYHKLVASNKALKSLLDVSKMPRIEVLSKVKQLFRVTDEEGALTKALQDAQKPVARVRPKIDEACNRLRLGESDAEKLTEPRWKAGYYLALGRCLAAKARVDGYIEMCAKLNTNPRFKDPKSSAWYAVQTNDPTGISSVDKSATAARKYLNKVIEDYPGTPWARVAELELEVPLGWSWREQ